MDHPPKLSIHTNNLPVSLTSLIGRALEMHSIQALLLRPDVRLLTLTGTAGVGKTRLALEVARDLANDFADGVHVVSLAPISDPAFVIATIAHSIGLTESGSQPVLELLKISQRDKLRLLLLDNFEHVITAAPLLAELLEACSQLKLLVTSREVLRIRGERQFAVSPLALPALSRLPDDGSLAYVPAVQLFIQRAQAVRSDFQLTKDHAATIAEICLRLDGLPLAIELAAARVKVLSLQALLTRLEHRLQLLIGGARDLPERQQTLRNTIQWSYDLLSEEEQRLFRRLAVFVGGCTLEAVEALDRALGSGVTSVLEGVASLFDKSLLQHTEQPHGESRLMMLETIREYGLEALAANDEMEVTRQAHAHYYLALAEEAEPELAGPQQAEWLERLERAYDNLRAALRWLLEQGETNQSRKEMALRLAGELWQFWEVRCHYSEGRAFLKQALAGSEQIRAVVRAKALLAAGELALEQGDYAIAEVLLEETLALFRQIGDRRGIAHALWELGKLAVERGGLTAGRILFENALKHAREVDDKEHTAWSLVGLAYIESNQGEYARARSLLEEALMMQRALGNKRGIISSLLNLAEVLFVSQSDRATVDPLLEEGLELSKELGDKEGLEYFYFLSGQLALNRGDIVTARSLAEKTLVINRELGNMSNTTLSLFLIARVEARQGDNVAARALYEEGLALAKEIGNKSNIASYLEGLAQVVSLQGEELWAARLWGAANALREAIHTPLPPIDRADYERSVAAVRGSLGEKAFTAAWSQGRVMSPEQALVAQEREMIMRLPADQPPTSPMKSSPTYPNGLTAREVEVLRLLAKGLTSAQIAEQLVIGVVTVNFHVRSIYSKLGVTSRSAATRYALDHHLV